MFQVWDFRATHSTLVLVSNPGGQPDLATRIEIAFGGVQFMSLPPVIRDLHIRRADPDFRSRMIERLDLDIPPSPGLDMFRLSDSKDWFVVAGAPYGAEAVRIYSDPLVLFEDLAPESPDLVRWTLR